MKEILKFIITGYERSGTTMLSEVFRNHPAVDSGFECGVLMCERPSEFINLKPFSSNITHGWNISDGDFALCCESNDFNEFYCRLRRSSVYIRDKNVQLFDKTPRYMKYMSNIMDRSSCNIICLYKDPHDLFLSWTMANDEKIIKSKFDDYLKEYTLYAWAIASALKRSDAHRIVLVKYDDIIYRPIDYLYHIFEHVGLEFDPEYINFKSKYPVTGHGIERKHLKKYINILSKKMIDRISDKTLDISSYLDSVKFKL